jgi:formylglycine-generating enzyme required for sulfatase activity
MRIAPLCFGALAVLTVAPVADAHRPPRADAWWGALGDASTQVPADGVRVLRSAPGGRVRVAGGTFVMGSTPAQMAQAIELCEHEVYGTRCREGKTIGMVRAEGKAHPVTLSTFDLDRTEVTIRDYARCVSAGVCGPSDVPADDPRFDGANLPATRVRFEDAAAYCAWAGGRLPTEAEWEYAARGAEGRAFPWGNVYNPHLANHGASAPDTSDATDGFAGLAPVGSFPDGATPLGLLDMAGNAAEWVADILEIDAHDHPVGYAEDAVTDPPANTQGGAAGGFHVVRGGSFDEGAMWLRGAARDTTILPRPPHVGFRCAADAR